MNKYLAILTTILALALIVTVKTCNSAVSQLRMKDNVLAAMVDTISYYQDQQGREHAQRQIAEADLKTAQEVYAEMLDSVAKALKIKQSSIKSIAGVKTVDSSHIIVMTDTVRIGDKVKKHIAYNDKWLQLNATIGDSAVIDYKTYDSIIVTTYAKGKGWFKHDTYIDAYNLNPNAKVVGLQGVLIQTEKKKHWSVGPYIGYGFTGLSVGLAVQYSLIKF